MLAAWMVINRQAVVDWWRLSQYKPSAAVKQLADNDTMIGRGRDLFYISDPQIQDSAAFNKACKNEGEKTIVLGCYKLQDIYLYNVTDARFNGVKEVTAAHEMLHAAYERLSGDGSKSCYSCHVCEKGLTDGLSKSMGAFNKQLPRSSPTLWNIGYHKEFYWDGRSGSLEKQAMAAWTGANMGAKADEIAGDECVPAHDYAGQPDHRRGEQGAGDPFGGESTGGRAVFFLLCAAFGSGRSDLHLCRHDLQGADNSA